MKMQIIVQVPKPRSDAARALADNRYHHRVVRDKKKYSRKGRNSSKQFGNESSRALLSSRAYRELTELVLQQIHQRNSALCLGGHHDRFQHSSYRSRTL